MISLPPMSLCDTVLILHIRLLKKLTECKQLQGRLIELRFYISLNTNLISEMLFPANLFASTEKTKIKNQKK